MGVPYSSSPLTKSAIKAAFLHLFFGIDTGASRAILAVAVVANPVLHSKCKHVELDLFSVSEKVADGSLVVGEVPACDQVANIPRKPLSVSTFARFRSLLQVLPLEKLGEAG
ncbi:hypothetical protein PVK06_019828 [Gossypium arboreum]|uniref:Uncharacterized protein n=1 Tax=Gossypium arboreum TaxID=29729 RepID=A0ABR0PL74_GOSAR|nr:hypothetical protein PVK06_019828 [Gossypium arboreum]